jgi:pathogenesis-related protein 1
MSTRVLCCTLICTLIAALAACSAAEAAPLSKPNKKAPSDRILPPTTKPKLEPKPIEFTGEEIGALAGLSAAHNQARGAVGVAPLEWAPTLSRYAQDWANQLAANNCQLAHRPNRPYGENLFWTSSGATSQYVVDFWAAEGANYDIETNGCTGSTCGHYTQIVWAATTKVGCGMATCGAQQVWVCNYDPPGNLYNQKPY